ncbi:MAG: prepilin peptidase, partial [Angustibacter sp.]
CPHCQQPIAARDNIPVFGWLLLRGRCRSCATAISRRYPLIELLTGLLFAAVGWRFGLTWQLAAFLYLAAIAVALAVIDIDVMRLPNEIVLPSFPVAGLLLLLPAALTPAWGDLLRGLLAMVALFTFFFILQMFFKGKMGFGDTKLIALLALHLGFLGWVELAVGFYLAFLLGAGHGVWLMIFRGGNRKSRLPFGPFLIAGAFLAILIPDPFVNWYLDLIQVIA